jgi:hypothetical protein
VKGFLQPHGGQPVGLGIGQGTQQQRIDHAENGRIGADSDGQGAAITSVTPALLRSMRSA